MCVNHVSLLSPVISDCWSSYSVCHSNICAICVVMFHVNTDHWWQNITKWWKNTAKKTRLTGIFEDKFITMLLAAVASCSASDYAYSYTFICSLSFVMCHTCAPCLNHWMVSDAIWQVHLWGPVTHCIRCRSLTLRGRGDLGLKPQPKHVFAFGLICDSTGGSIDHRFHFYAITSVLVFYLVWKLISKNT